MTIEKTIIKVRDEPSGRIYDVEISTDLLIDAIKNAKSTEYLWLYIEGWIKGIEDFEKNNI